MEKLEVRCPFCGADGGETVPQDHDRLDKDPRSPRAHLGRASWAWVP